MHIGLQCAELGAHWIYVMAQAMAVVILFLVIILSWCMALSENALIIQRDFMFNKFQ